MRSNHHYATYYSGLARLLVHGAIPFVLLAYYNNNIYKGLKLPSNLRQDHQPRPSRYNQETDLARVLIGIVITFISCNGLRILLDFQEMIVMDKAEECFSAGKHGLPVWYLVTIDFSHFMLVVNSSVNLIIYCCLNTAFRRQMASCKTQFCIRLGYSSAVTDTVQGNINFEMQQQLTTTTRDA